MSDLDCIFCKIISGNAESSNIYEDEKVLAFMNIQPAQKGEFLVIPKIHVDNFIELSDDLASHIIITAQKLSKNLNLKLNPLRIGYLVHGFGVSHAHLNVIPLYSSNEIVSLKQLKVVDNQIINDINLIPKPSRSELDQIAKLIKF